MGMGKKYVRHPHMLNFFNKIVIITKTVIIGNSMELLTSLFQELFISGFGCLSEKYNN